MILGMPWQSWVLLCVAVVPGLWLVTNFYLKHRRKRQER
jgi:hypothetical protein